MRLRYRFQIFENVVILISKRIIEEFYLLDKKNYTNKIFYLLSLTLYKARRAIFVLFPFILNQISLERGSVPLLFILFRLF